MGNKKSYLKVKTLTEQDKLAWPILTRLNSNESTVYKNALENYCALYVTILIMKLDCDMSAQTESIINVTHGYIKQLEQEHQLTYINQENFEPFSAETELEKIFKLWRNEVNDFSQLNQISVSDIIAFYNSAVTGLVSLEEIW